MNVISIVGALTRDPKPLEDGSALLLTIGNEREVEGRVVTSYLTGRLGGAAAQRLLEQQPAQGAAIAAQAQLSPGPVTRLSYLTAHLLDFVPELERDSAGGVRMLGGENRAIIRGTVTQTPVLRPLQGQGAAAVLKLPLSVYQPSGAEPVYADITVWHTEAQAWQHASPGTRVLVYGSATQSTLTKDGKKMTKTGIEAHSLYPVLPQGLSLRDLQPF